MKAIIEQADLSKLLNRVSRVTERRNTIPILGNIKLAVEQDEIVVTGTDLDVELRDKIKAQVAAKGETTVPAHLLSDIVKKMPTGSQITIEQVDTVIKVQSGRSRFTLQTLPTSDFPDLGAGDLTIDFTLPGKDLFRLFDRTAFAISTEETRYYLNGVYFHSAGGHNSKKLCAVATDGHRLAKLEIPLPEAATSLGGVIVPRKTVAEVMRLFTADAEEVRVELSANKIRFSAGDIVLTSKLIDGTFPDYGRVIPQSNEKELKVDKKDLQAAVDRVAAVSSERGRAVKFSIANGKVTLSVSNPDAGSATDELDAEYSADAIEIGFNSRYFQEILAEVEGDVVTVKLADPGSPTIMTGEKDDSLFVLMPMRV